MCFPRNRAPLSHERGPNTHGKSRVTRDACDSKRHPSVDAQAPTLVQLLCAPRPILQHGVGHPTNPYSNSAVLAPEARRPRCRSQERHSSKGKADGRSSIHKRSCSAPCAKSSNIESAAQQNHIAKEPCWLPKQADQAVDLEIDIAAASAMLMPCCKRNRAGAKSLFSSTAPPGIILGQKQAIEHHSQPIYVGQLFIESA